jgi:PPK2 family polyphosphate:nucleotide phosphotransferase
LNVELSKISARAPESLSKADGKAQLETLLEEIAALQNLLMADRNHSLLVVIQGMDASGKDGLIRTVFGAMNPMGIRVQAFKAPTEEEASHDFLWRIHKHTPAKGQVMVFNRSQYEDLIMPAIRSTISKTDWKHRAQSINDFERHLTQNSNTHILKLFLHVSHEEQHKRLQERMDVPEKMWKYNANDLVESARWDDYMAEYESIFKQCSEVPWQIIPADQNWYKELLVAQQVVAILKSLPMAFPGMKQDS